MNAAVTGTAADAARLPLMLAALRLPTIKRLWPELAEQSNREGWPAERIRTRVAELLSLHCDCVGLKAKTPEGLNLDNAAIAHVVVLLEKSKTIAKRKPARQARRR